jgi:hypothetical protein
VFLATVLGTGLYAGTLFAQEPVTLEEEPEPAAPTAPAEPGNEPAAAAETPGAGAPAAEATATAAATTTGTADANAEVSGVAVAGGPKKKPSQSTLGLSPGAPQVATLPGGITPAFGSQPTRAQDWRFDFHGFMLVPLRVGIGEREQAAEGQKTTTLHAPPRVPGELETFEYTAVTPDPWVQLNFSYGNPNVTATVIVAARTVSNANAYFDPTDYVGVNDAFLTFKLGSEKARFNVNVGAFANRYGNLGEYDMGRYGTPIIARVSGTGVTGTGMFDLGGDLNLVTEAGFTGQLNKAPVGVEPAGWNGFADPNVGTSFAAHAHAALGFKGIVTVGGHFIHTFVQDDRATPTTQPDGSIDTMAGDLRLTMGRFGHLYGAVAHTNAETARSVSNVIRILNAPGGPGLINEYFGPNSNGTGKLLVIGGQYDLSVGNLLRSPAQFNGDGPDLIFSAFGVQAKASSDDKAFDGVSKLKYGSELAYSALKWFALGGRYDRVQPNTDDDTQTHAIVTARAMFRSNWNSNDQVTLQYSRFLSGSGTTVIDGYPPARDPSIVPDEQVISLTGSMWW